MHARNAPRSFLFSLSLVALAAAVGCSTPPGRCVGAPGPLAPDQKILQNLDAAGVALQGYDPVAYFTMHKAVKGDPAIRSTRLGAVYHFTSDAHRAMFEADPAKYEPRFGGWCAYAASVNALSPIDPAYWEIVDGRLILQHNQKAWDLWHRDPAANLVKADANWPGLVARNGAPPRALVNIDPAGLALDGYDPTSYFLDGMPLKGDPALARSFQGATYHFVDARHKNAFEAEPARFVPQFGGFCGYAASINKVSPVNPTIWQLQHDRLVLQHTPEAFRLYNADPEQNYARAEKNWPALSHRRCAD